MREKIKNTLSVTPELIQYCEDHFATLTPAMQQLRQQTGCMPEGHMQITVLQGQLLAFLIKLTNAKRILEIGTYTGYSALVMALATAEDGHITTCDRNAEWTKIARKFWALAQVDKKITLLLGDALETLEKLKGQNPPLFDMIFIDGSKRSYKTYFEETFPLLKVGGLVVVDNTLWYGHVANPHTENENAQKMQEFNTFIKNHARVEKTLCGSPTDTFVVLMKKE